MTKNKKLTFGEKLGYGIATAGDGAVYNFVGIYFLFFLTTVAGVEPGKAGTLSSISLLASAFFTIFIGYFSDNSKCKFGRRRPYIMVGLPFLFISFVLMFTTVDLGENIKLLYYGFFSIVFWLGYAMFYVPYTALGAEITNDYDDRTRIRTYAVTCNSVGNYFGMVFPLLLVGMFVSIGSSNEASWVYTAIVSAIVAVIAIGIMIWATKGKELIIPSKEASSQKNNIFKDYIDVLKVKPCKFLVASMVLAIIAFSVFNGSVAYFVKYNLGLPDSYTSAIFLVLCLAIIVYAPILNKLATAFGKKASYIVALTVCGVLLAVFKFVGIESQMILLVVAGIYTLGGAGYWQLMSAIVYDLAEVIELKYGKRSEGSLSSLQSVFQQIGTALGMAIMGFVLELTKFDGNAAIQSQSALTGIEFLVTVIPAAGYIFAALFMYIFPVNKDKYQRVLAAIEEKKEKGEYNSEGLERIV